MTDVRHLLKAYLDGELTAEETQSVEQALIDQPELADELDKLRMLSSAIKNLGSAAQEGSEAGLQQTLSRLQATKSEHPRPKLPLYAFPIAAAMIFLAGVFIQQSIYGQAKIARKSHSETASSPESVGSLSEADMYDAKSVDGAAPGNMRSPSRPRAESPGEEAASSQPVLPNLNRQVIKTANLAIDVTDIDDARLRAEQAVQAIGGDVESSEASSYENSRSASLVLRVPANGFDQLIVTLRSLGDVTVDNSTKSDVTAEVADVKARLRVMRAEEEQYIDILASTKTVGEILAVKERLGRIRAEIESLEARQRVLSSQVSMSTVYLQLSERPVQQAEGSKSWLERTWERALYRLTEGGKAVAKIGINLLVLAPFWVPPIVLAWWLVRRYRPTDDKGHHR